MQQHTRRSSLRTDRPTGLVLMTINKTLVLVCLVDRSFSSADRNGIVTHVFYNVEARYPRLRKSNISTGSPLHGEYDCSFLIKFRLLDRKL